MHLFARLFASPTLPLYRSATCKGSLDSLSKRGLRAERLAAIATQSSLRLIACAITVFVVDANFLYKDFSDTTGLQFNGNAGTTSCGRGGMSYGYSATYGINDAFAPQSPYVRTDDAGALYAATTDAFTSGIEAARSMTARYAVFPHRDDVVAGSDTAQCTMRIR